MSNDGRHNYEYDVELEGETAPAKVIRMVGKDKRVLEVGAGPGSITKPLHIENSCVVTGLEVDPTAIEKLRPFCDQVFDADLNQATWRDTVAIAEGYDVVVAADVLEHVDNPWETLQLMGTLVSEDGYVVISVPHIGHSAVIACLLNNDFHYQDWGLLDRTHIRFFCANNVQSLFEGAGLSIVEVEFVVTRPEHSEFSQHWNMLSTAMRGELDKAKYGNVYQFVIKAVPKGAGVSSIKIEDVEVPSAPSSISLDAEHQLKSLLKRLLPASCVDWLKRVIGK